MKPIVLSFALLLLCTNIGVSQSVAETSAYRSSDNTLFILPTGQTIPKGTHQLNSFQLFFIGYNYGITDRLQVGAFSFFPVSAGLVRQSFSVSVKYSLYSSDRLDIAGMGVIVPINGVTMAVSSATYRVNRTRLHGGLGVAFVIDDPADTAPIVAMFGIDHNLGPRVSLMGEYATFASSIVDDATGVFTIGARFHFENGNIDFGGLRPGGTGGDFIAVPFLRGTIEF